VAGLYHWFGAVKSLLRGKSSRSGTTNRNLHLRRCKSTRLATYYASFVLTSEHHRDTVCK